ncbi:Glu/Leu/Phe/Val dehydrogenase [bacterium]|nr:Glu/Leu/Phe/Val dehydrogenase [bacterium]
MNILEQMREYGHERVAFHQDPQTGLRAIIALHSSVLGNALGGTRRWCYATEQDALHDVLRLSQGMTYKCACAGLPMGGGKSVVWLPQRGHAPTEAEARAMGRFVDTFNGVYIAAEDVGTTPQYIDWMAMETAHVMGGEQVSRGGDPSPFTARGVFNGMKACLEYAFGSPSVEGRTVAVQGLGNVGTYLVKLLVEPGARVIGADINRQHVERCVDQYGITAASTDEILLTECDVLAPCALGGVIDANTARKLNCRVVCGGANKVLDCPEEDAVVLKSRGIVYGVDFVVNAGGVIELSGQYLNYSRQKLDAMNDEIEATTAQILREGETLSSTYEAAIALGDRRIAAGAASKRERIHAG